jgi:hypothetical protein
MNKVLPPHQITVKAPKLGINILGSSTAIWNLEIVGFQISDPKSEVSDREEGRNRAASIVSGDAGYLSDISDFGSEI